MIRFFAEITYAARASTACAAFLTMAPVTTAAFADQGTFRLDMLEAGTPNCDRGGDPARLLLAPNVTERNLSVGIEKLGLGVRPLRTRRGTELVQQSFIGPDGEWHPDALPIDISAEFDVCIHPTRLDIRDGQVRLEANQGTHRLSSDLDIDALMALEAEVLLSLSSETTLRGADRDALEGSDRPFVSRHKPILRLYLKNVPLVFEPKDGSVGIVPMTLSLDGHWRLAEMGGE